MTIDEKIAVLEAAKVEIVDLIVAGAQSILPGGDYLEGTIAKMMADRGAIEDLLFDLREGFEQAKIDEQFDSALAEQMETRQ